MFRRYPLFEENTEGSGAGGNLGTLESAVESALKVVNKEEPKPEEKKVETKVETTESSPAEKLWAALNDPAQADKVIAALASAAGWTKAEKVEKIEEIKEAIEDDDEKALIEALGDDFSSFAKKLTPALKKIIERGVESKTKDLREKVAKRDATEIEGSVNGAIKELSQEHFKSDKLTAEQETELTRLTKKYPPTKGQSPKEYLEDFFKLLPKGKVQEITQRTNENRSDAGSRLASGAGGKTEVTQSSKPSGEMSLDDAAFAAAQKIKVT